MERITISLDQDLLASFDAYVTSHGYANRSEAFRDLVRDRLTVSSLEEGPGADCVGCFSYVYDHGKRQLARRLIESQHAHHEIGLSTLHVHLDHDHCMEVAVLKGPVERVRAFAEATAAERGVHHANLHLVGVTMDVARHRHRGSLPAGGSSPSHAHVHPRD